MTFLGRSVWMRLPGGFLILFLWAGHVFAQNSLAVSRNDAWIDFPESIDFRITVSADSPIESLELEYGVITQSCGEVTAVAALEFDPSTELDLTWRWDILKEQIIPPGAQIWWRWRLTTADDSELYTPTQTITFLDTWFVWQSITAENLTVHWYRGSRNMARQMLEAGLTAVHQLSADAGLNLDDPIHLYLYEEPFDLQLSVPGAPGWAGGVAFPEHSLVLAVAQKDYLAYSEDTIRHELGHLITGRLTFNCLHTLPTWLSEGLAMVAEGPDSDHLEEQLGNSIRDDSLLSISQLEGNFSVHAEKARLSYAESYSLVRFLLDHGGPQRMGDFLSSFQRGATSNDALVTSYGWDVKSLETAWREAIGAANHDHPEPTTKADKTSTPVPTMALPVAAAITALPPTPTATATMPATAVSPSKPPTQQPDPTLVTPQLTPDNSPDASQAKWLSPLSFAGLLLVFVAILIWLFRQHLPTNLKE